MGVGERIRQIRILNGMTQEELAKKMGYKSKTTITKIENEVNSIPVEKLQKFADALHTSVAILMGEMDDPVYVIGPHLRGYLKEKGVSLDIEPPSAEENPPAFIELMDIAMEMNDEGIKKLIQYAEDIKDKYTEEGGR